RRWSATAHAKGQKSGSHPKWLPLKRSTGTWVAPPPVPHDPGALVRQLDAEGRCVQLENCRAFSASAIDLKFLGGKAGQISCFCNTRGKSGRRSDEPLLL